MVIKNFIFTSNEKEEIGLGFLSRNCFKRTSKLRERMELTFVTSIINLKKEKLKNNSLFLSVHYKLPMNYAEEQSLKRFWESIERKGSLEAI